MNTIMNFIVRLSAPAALAFLTLAPVAYADTGATSCKTANDAGSFVQYCIIGTIDTIVVPLVFAIAFIVFLWGVYQYFIAGGANEEKRQQGQQFVLWSVIGFFLMLSIWGIVNVLTGTFGFSSATRPATPLFNQSNASAANGAGGTNTTVNSQPGTPTQAGQGSTDANGVPAGNAVPY